jgi:hypothetical protein
MPFQNSKSVRARPIRHFIAARIDKCLKSKGWHHAIAGKAEKSYVDKEGRSRANPTTFELTATTPAL